MEIQIYDTTLRDGMQREGISFSVGDKLKIAHKLDELGVHFIEGGWPSSNPKDTQFFSKAQDMTFSHAVLCSFGSTRRPNTKAEDDPNLHALINSGTRVATLVGKSSDIQVTRALRISLEENLNMIGDSIRYLRRNGLRVFYDAEHFFDGCKAYAKYSLATIQQAEEAGAECIILCDTNGGSLPHEVAQAVAAARKAVSTPLGIHAHNDSDVAVANTLAAVQSGVVHVQGTINGYGERCGNANLCSVITALQLKMGIHCVSSQQLSKMTDISHFVSEIANLSHDPHQPYTGASAFTHKGGIHVSAVAKQEDTYQHIDPGLVGNCTKVTVSELSGVSNIIYKAKECGVQIPVEGKQARQILNQIKFLESMGFQYEGADASFELLVRRANPDYRPPFELVDFMVVVEKRRRLPTIGSSKNQSNNLDDSFPDRSGLQEILSEATIKVKVGDEIIHTAAEGNGPVNALDNALRKALVQFYPKLSVIRLTDYKVRILEENAGTESLVRVLIESSADHCQWRTVGSSTDIIQASWLALADSLEYWMIKDCNL
ncbi:MAG: citramalate synthase [Chloroflexota bacterium]|nr:citramalate synthase [Chloroflexota bacterium]